MRKPILLLLFLVALTSTVLAQRNFSPTFNTNYAYNNGPVWAKGTYSDLQGVQHAGFILLRDGGDKPAGIDFKPEKHDKKISIPADSLTTVMFKDDTFLVSHSSILKSPFIELVISSNAIKLYHQRASSYFSAYGIKDVWYYGADKDNLSLLDKKNFITVMPQIMADKPDVVNNIVNKSYKYIDMVDLITYYQTGREPWLDRRDN